MHPVDSGTPTNKLDVPGELHNYDLGHKTWTPAWTLSVGQINPPIPRQGQRLPLRGKVHD